MAGWTADVLAHRLQPSHGRREEAEQADERPHYGKRRLRPHAKRDARAMVVVKDGCGGERAW